MNDNLPPNYTSSEYCWALQRLLLRTSNPKLGLERMEKLLKLIGFDRSSMRIIQVVGTNGKGSTVAFIESILLFEGISCGLFTSPHLCTARERIRVNGVLIHEDEFVEAAHHVLAAANKMSDEASFFECILAMAMWIFQKRKLDIVILEAGLGGRLDATTAVNADILGITSIGLDHQNVLGETIALIAQEKIAACQRNQTVVSVEQPSEAMETIGALAKVRGCNLYISSPTDMPIGLFGKHQCINAGLALDLLRRLPQGVSKAAQHSGLMNVNWPGRFEVLKREVYVVLDGAHNPAGITVLTHALNHHDCFMHKPLFIVYGSLASHNVSGKIKVLKQSGLDIARIYVHAPRNPRAMTREHLRDVLIECGFADGMVGPFENMATVIEEAKAHDAAVVVCGSLYTIGEIRSVLLNIPMDKESPSF